MEGGWKKCVWGSIRQGQYLRIKELLWYKEDRRPGRVYDKEVGCVKGF